MTLFLRENMDFEFPYVGFNGRGYDLYFVLPKEYEQWKKEILPSMNHEGIERMAKSIFEKNDLSTLGFPRFKWSECGELENIALGLNCACVSKSKGLSGESYHFHNIDFPHQALAALEILSTFYTWVSAAAEKSKAP